ncbi:MAG: GGDEF and EAL domain-containing protein [Acetatifactor sp.]|nr:GGDEF and EAL domain-containing protein [Acetatifactor sp.]
MDNKKHKTEDFSQLFDMFCEIADTFAPCMKDYLYVYNLTEDTYYISEQAVDRFLLPSNLFQNVGDVLSVLTHPDDIDMLNEDIELVMAGKKDFHNLEYRWLGRDGSPIWINCRGRILRDDNGKPQIMLGCINEIGNKQKADNISGLLGESAMHDMVIQQLPTLTNAMFLRVGIDDFKVINERHGMEYGNYILREVASRIQNCADSQQYVYRIVSDEFMVLDLSDSDYNKMNRLYHQIRSSVDELVASEQYKALYTISGGLVALEDIKASESEYNRYSEIMKTSEFALTEAKLRGKNQLYSFRPEEYTAFLRRRYIRSCMRKALSDNFRGFDLHFQPIIMTSGEFLFAAESLLRFETPTGEKLSPLEFIPILEESGMIIPVGRWILRNALEMCKRCREFYPEFMISINFSYIQLLKSPVYEDVMRALNEAELPPSCLIVELTESGHLENSSAIQSVWQKLRALGVNIALDDFGTGYSNLINIGNLRPNIVKIDRGFTIKALHNKYEYELLLHVIKMVHSIGLNLVVEGIESRMELMQITAMNPDYIQGYYYSKPCPKEEFIRKYHPDSSRTSG